MWEIDKMPSKLYEPHLQISNGFEPPLIAQNPRFLGRLPTFCLGSFSGNAASGV